MDIAATLGSVRLAILGVYAVLSVVLFAVYGMDKRAAVKGGWRTPEATLHALALLGGWPGALFARRVFRHKTKKRPFVMVFWCTVILNSAGLLWLLRILPMEPV